MTENSFPTGHRLLRSEEFDAVFQNRDVTVSSRSFLLLGLRNNLKVNRLGMVIAKKNIPRAVDRNRVKRCIREVFRQTTDVNGIDLVVLARQGALQETNLRAHFDKLWTDLQTKAATR